MCHDNDSLHGIAWQPLREQLDRAELTKSFVLNPLAPEFVPNRQFHRLATFVVAKTYIRMCNVYKI